MHTHTVSEYYRPIDVSKYYMCPSGGVAGKLKIQRFYKIN